MNGDLMKTRKYFLAGTVITLLSLSLTQNNASAVTEDQYEPDNTTSEAKTIQPGIAQGHSIHSNSDVDWMKFTAQSTENIELKVTGLEGGIVIKLYSSDLTYLASSNIYSTDTIIRFSGIEPGAYYVTAEDNGNNNTNNLYYIQLKTTVGNGDNYEGDNVPEEASVGNKGGTQSRSIVPANDYDWIKFSLNAIDNIELKTTGLQGGLNIKLYSSDLTYLYNSSNYSTYSVLRVPEIEPGNYYAKIEDSSNNDENESYNFTIKTSLSNSDTFEPDNVYSDAGYIYPKIPQKHSIIPTNDRDWIQFTLSAEDNIELTTSGLEGGIAIELYDNIFNLLEKAISYSGHPVINKTLEAGKYYAVFYDYQENNENDLYYIHLTGSHVVISGQTQKTTLAPILHLLLKK
ncbi:MAG: hypothetical protein D3916_00470 [Candidatus Electrothrix sp. MAN1_4]|nr:hypothetical protein [Candidatus Electrothrix sp. MAN1_4]